MNDSNSNGLLQSDSSKRTDRKSIKKLTRQEEAIVGDFCGYMNEIQIGGTFTLWNVQGVLQFANPGVPDEQKYDDLLRIATEAGWIEPVSGEPDTYRRTKSKKKVRSKHAFMCEELQVLKSQDDLHLMRK